MALPTDIEFGKVIARYILAVADTTDDADHDPDPKPANGTVTFTPMATRIVSMVSPVTSVAPQKVVGTLIDGVLCDPTGNPGITLVSGFYNVSFSIADVSIPGFPIQIETNVTKDLSLEQPIVPLPVEKFVVSEQVMLDTFAARDAAIASAADLRSGGRLAPRAPLRTGVDINTLVDNGFYYGSDMTNAPDSGFYYVFVQSSTDVAYVRQTVSKAGLGAGAAGPTWVRFREGGEGWSPWRQVADKAGAYDPVARVALVDGGRLAPFAMVVTNGDCNDLAQNGFYRGANMKNAPGGNANWQYIFVEAHDNNGWIKQTATLYASGDALTADRSIWVRQKRNAVWDPWVQIADKNGAVDKAARDDVATRMSPTSISVTGQDFNDLKTSGWYRGMNMANGPMGAQYAWHFIQVIADDTRTWAEQRVTVFYGGDPAPSYEHDMYVRWFRGGTWGTWKKVGDELGGFDPKARGAVKKAAYRMGGTHGSTNLGGSGQTSIRERTPGLQLPVQATRWRIHFRNYNSLTSSNSGSSPLTVQRVHIGKTAGNTSTSEYACTAALQQIPGAAGSVQGTTEWVSDWHTPASVGITDTRQKFNVQFDLTCTANDYIGMTSSMFCAMIDTTATGTGVVSPTVADPGTIGGSGSATSWYSYNYMVGEAWIEYEYQDASVPNLLFVGHSYVDAAQFSGTAGQYGQPSGFSQKYSRRHKAAVTVNALSTSKMTDWANGTAISNKFDILTVAQGYNFDGIFVMLGGNDIVNESPTPSAATLISRFQAVVNAIATRYPGVPVFAATSTPIGAVGDTTWGSGGTAVTQAMLDAMDGLNAGLFSSVRGLAGVLDFEAVIKDPANPRRPLLAFLGSDRIHPNPRGYDALADAITLY